MVKKQNSNVWLVYLIALIAIVALILGAVAVYKANMTGNAFWDLFRAKEKTVCGDGVCEPPENNFTCPEDCVVGGGGPDTAGWCNGEGGTCPAGIPCCEGLSCYMGTCQKSMSPGVNPDGPAGVGGGYGLLGGVFVAEGNDASQLINYETKFDVNGNMIYEVVEGGTKINAGENYEVVQNSEDSDIVEILSDGFYPTGATHVTMCRCGELCGDSTHCNLDTTTWKCTGVCPGSLGECLASYCGWYSTVIE